MFAYCNNNPVNGSDPFGLAGIGLLSDWNPKDTAMSDRNSKDTTLVLSSKNKPNIKPRKDPKKGSERRQPSGERERNVGHKNGEEHSRVPKGSRPGVGNKSRRIEVEQPTIIIVSTVCIICLVADDFTGVGVADDILILPAAQMWWDAACKSISLMG